MFRLGPVEVLLLSIILIGGVTVFFIWLVKRVARRSARDELQKYHHELHEQAETMPEAKDQVS